MASTATALTTSSGTSETTGISSTNASETCIFALLDQCELTILLSTIMFYVTIVNVIAGIIANFVVIGVIIAIREMRTIPSVYIAHLAITDITFLIFVGGSNCYEYYIGAYQPTDHTSIPPVVVYYMELVTALATVLMMAALTMDRFFAIVYPLKSQRYRTKKRAAIICLAVWIVSFAVGGVYFGAPTGGDQLEIWKEPNAKYLVSLGVVFTFILPLLIIFGCYIGIMRAMWKKRLTQLRASEQSRFLRNRQKHAVLRASIFIVALFTIINGYFNAMFVWIAVGGSRFVEPSVVIIVYHSAQGLLHLNSLINPFLYALSHEKFYHYIWRAVRCSCCPSTTSKKSIQNRKLYTLDQNGVAATNNGEESWKYKGVYNFANDDVLEERSTRL